MIAGRVPVGVFSYGPVSAQAGAGALRMIALSTADRHPAVAEIPTLKELGYDIIAPSWVALSAPAALDASIVLRLNEATNRILSREEIKSRLFEDAIQTQPLNPAQTRAFVEAETAAWKDRLRVTQMLK